MLLQRADKMFASADWFYEPKWDGFRTLASGYSGYTLGATALQVLATHSNLRPGARGR